jgi:hypothetical protein
MRFPQVSERVKEAPANALRAVFASIGQVLLVTDRMKNKPTEEEHAASRRTDEAAAGATAPAPAAETTPAATPEPAAERTVPEAVGETTAPETAPPLPNYEQLTIASLRARLRGLTVVQVRELIVYERAHAARPDVISMFERRVTKLETPEG